MMRATCSRKQMGLIMKATVFASAACQSAAVALVTVFGAVQAQAGCDITVKANYSTAAKDGTGKTLDRLRIDLTKSEVRAKPGFWKSMGGMCTPNQPLIGLGNDAAVSCELDLACGKRQFRVYFYGVDANGNNVEAGFTAFPSGSDWIDLDNTKTINLGDLGKKL
jgi:hypothetical protein